MKTFNSSVDMVILTDYVIKRAIELSKRWEKKTGNELPFRHKENHFASLGRLLQKYIRGISKTGAFSFTHTNKDEDALFNIGSWVTYKHAELEGFSEPSNPWVEGETFVREGLRYKSGMTSKFLEAAIAEYGRMMNEGIDPIEKSKTNEIIFNDKVKPRREISEGGIILNE